MLRLEKRASGRPVAAVDSSGVSAAHGFGGRPTRLMVWCPEARGAWAVRPARDTQCTDGSPSCPDHLGLLNDRLDVSIAEAVHEEDLGADLVQRGPEDYAA